MTATGGIAVSPSATLFDEMIDLFVEIELARHRARKDAWIAAARREFVPSEKSPCCVCGRHRLIAHAHHLIPLARQFDRRFTVADHSHVWLCPNHHAILHAFIDHDVATRTVETAVPFFEGGSREEMLKIIDLCARSAGRV